MDYLFLILGLIGSIYFYSDIKSADESNNWISTYAVLDSFETPSYWVNKQGYEKECKRIKANYSYTFENNDYSSNTVSILPQVQMWAHQTEALVKKYKWKQGKQIKIYVNPDKPNEAVMLKGSKEISIDVWIFFSFSLLLFIGGLINVIRSLMSGLSPLDLESEVELNE